jgi:hypothetical protein
MTYLECPTIEDFYAISASPFFEHRHADQEAYLIRERLKIQDSRKSPS